MNEIKIINVKGCSNINTIEERANPNSKKILLFSLSILIKKMSVSEEKKNKIE